AALMLALCGAIALDTRRLSFWDDTTPGPAFLPVWLAIAGVVLFALRLAEARRLRATMVDWPSRAALKRVAMTFAALLVVPLLAPLLGLVPALVLLVAFILVVVLRQALWPSLMTLAVTTGLIYAIFVLWLRVPLPQGVLGI
ncbi:MAG TPA: tripartite tricarboxylate transporter TctB family protein, partial [Burkholderiales bacterium]